MASAKKRKNNKGGRKLEFAIYIIGVILICLVVLGIVKGVQGVTKLFDDDVTQTDVSDSSVENTPSRPTPSLVDQLQPAESKDASVASDASKDSSDTSRESAPEGDYITYTKSGAEELDEWYLRLINGNSTLDGNWKTDMTDVGGEQLDSRIVKAYRDMCNAASADGVTIYAISGYRSYSTQQRLYNNRVDRAKRENPSFTQAQAEAYAATHVARPGTSEHQSGLAIDFNSVETSFGDTKAGKWLKENSEDYGFILRYEKDKQNFTGVTWEPWHYRFVGVKHAKRINELGYCLEEYVTYLQNGGQ
ncbi:MAG: M15 family metallopeptidase [Clostridia bacterium]|nr:M15 family metallopeptidase [Clostridia bacterium]